MSIGIKKKQCTADKRRKPERIYGKMLKRYKLLNEKQKTQAKKRQGAINNANRTTGMYGPKTDR
jgi:hypothetical protein